MKELRVAVCISGHMRTYEHTFRLLRENLIDAYDSDVFVHTWDTYNFSNTLPQFKWDDKIDPEHVRSVYDAREVVVQPASAVSGSKVALMFYKIAECDSLRRRTERETGEKYDWVVRIRPDIFLNEMLKLDGLDNEKIYVPDCNDHSGINDQIAWGGSNVMNVYGTMAFANDKMHMSPSPEGRVRDFLRESMVPLERPTLNYVLDGRKR